MNSNHIFSPQTPALAQKSPGRGRVKVAVFSVLALHVAGLTALLMTQGCKREVPPENPPMPEPPVMDTNAFPVMDTNALPPMDTNAFAPTPMPAPVPAPYVPEIPNPAPVPSASEYVVQAGDSFYTIAKNHGTTIAAIQAANPGVDSRRLKIGQKLVLPPPGAPSSPSSLAPAPGVSGGTETVYTVKSGDNLLRIASRFGTTVKAIKSLNGLTTDQIKVGQKLKIPAKPAPAPEPVPVAPTFPETAPAPVR